MQAIAREKVETLQVRAELKASDVEMYPSETQELVAKVLTNIATEAMLPELIALI